MEWRDGPSPGVRLLDQTRLPAVETYLDATTVDQVVDAVQRLAVRGAPALGAVGGYGVVVGLLQAERESWPAQRLEEALDRLRDARPTAANLAWGVARVRALVPSGVEAALAEAHRLVAEVESANRRLSVHGADWILARVEMKQVRVLTHCNTGSLATIGWGTGLGVVRELHARGRLGLVYVDETRPLLQGSRLTAWELRRDGIDHAVLVDAAAPSTILRHEVDVVVIGADRIAANGDTANKVGSVGLALACADAGVPFLVAAPSSTVDLSTADGAAIQIERRPDEEVLGFAGAAVTPAGSGAHNPAFDVTPRRLIDAVATEHGVVEPKRSPAPALFPATAR